MLSWTHQRSDPEKGGENEMDERVRQRILERQKAEHRPSVKECRPWRNTSGCLDPTACKAIANIMRKENKKKKKPRKHRNYKLKMA